MNQEWEEDAACRAIDPVMWDTADGDGHPDRTAMREAAWVCFFRCPVRRECLMASMHAPNDGPEPQGVWGGLSFVQRKRWTSAGTQEERDRVVELARVAAVAPVRRAV